MFSLQQIFMNMTIMKSRSIIILKEDQVKKLVDKIIIEQTEKDCKIEKRNNNNNQKTDS